MGKKPLSERQKAIMAFIKEYLGENGYPPTIREIGHACDIPSTSVVNYNLNRLESEGLISRDLKVSRGLRLVGGSSDPHIVRVPLLGRIAAGQPVPVPSSDFATFDDEDAIVLTRDIVDDDPELFALQVDGDSMIDAMINDGDVVIMKPHPNPKNGDLVAVWLKDREETTLKRYYLEKGKVRLQPENSTMQPIMIDDPSTVMVQGRVVAVVRQIN